MLMVIFGAGASYDSAPAFPGADNLPYRPPLTKDLFSTRSAFTRALLEFEELHTLVPHLRGLADLPIEQYLANLQGEAGELPHRHRQLAALRFYLQRILWEVPDKWYAGCSGITNYSGLLSDLQDWQVRSGEEVALVTFNYDTLLDRAYASALGFDPSRFSNDSLDAYVSGGPFYLFKPHGSVNWARRLRNSRSEFVAPVDAHRLIADAHRVEPTGQFEIARNFSVVNSQFDPKWLVMPALAIPVDTKTTFEFPGPHEVALRLAIPKITRLLIIGWRATEQSFLDLWKTRQPSFLLIQVVSPSNPEETCRNIENGGIGQVAIKSQMGFSEFVRTREIHKLLK